MLCSSCLQPSEEGAEVSLTRKWRNRWICSSSGEEWMRFNRSSREDLKGSGGRIQGFDNICNNGYGGRFGDDNKKKSLLPWSWLWNKEIKVCMLAGNNCYGSDSFAARQGMSWFQSV